MTPAVSILFVCLGNICRSPTAHGVFQQKVLTAGLARHIHIDSAGTAAYHLGKAPDSRTQWAAKQQGYDLSQLRARQVQAQDFLDFDYVLAMDKQNLRELVDLHRTVGERARCAPQLYLSVLDDALVEVPDPYYGGAEGFAEVLTLCEQASDAWLNIIREHKGL